VRPARQTLPPGSAHPARQEPPPRLAPEVSSDREKQLTEEINTTIQEVERILLSVDRQQLRSDQWETYQTIQSFLTQARKSVTHKDFQQAMNLAQKAHILSGELSNMIH
jgi:biopolymer transport protein ExbD